MLLGAVVLYTAGIRDMTSAAQALRPLADDFTFALFSGGITATGLLAVPVLASASDYVVAIAFGWLDGLERRWSKTKHLQAVIVVATLVGTVIDFTRIDPMKALGPSVRFVRKVATSVDFHPNLTPLPKSEYCLSAP